MTANATGIPFPSASQSDCRSFKCSLSSALLPSRGTRRLCAPLRGVDSPFFDDNPRYDEPRIASIVGSCDAYARLNRTSLCVAHRRDRTTPRFGFDRSPDTMGRMRPVLVEPLHEHIDAALYCAGAREEHRPVCPVLQRPVDPFELCVELPVPHAAADVLDADVPDRLTESAAELAAVVGDEEMRNAPVCDFTQLSGEIVCC